MYIPLTKAVEMSVFKFFKIYLLLSLIYPFNSIIAQDNIPQNLCYHFKPDEAITLQQAVNITLVCNRNIQKAFIGRVTQKYSLDTALYKFKPNIDLSGIVNSTVSSERDYVNNRNYHHSATSSSVIPRFNLLTPLGTTISLDWQSLATNPDHFNTFKNASKITIRQPLLKQSGVDLQTASTQNAKDQDYLQMLNLSNLIEDEINKTIFSFREISQNLDQLDIQEKNLTISKKLLEQTDALIQAGRLAEYEKMQVSSQVSSQELNLTDARINLKKSYLTLINQLGLNLNMTEAIDKITIQAQPLSSMVIPEPISKTPDQLFKQVLSKNIQYQTIVVQQQINKRDYHVAYDQDRWTLDLSLDHQLTSFDKHYKTAYKKYLHTPDRQTNLSLQFDIPLDFNPARTQALVENKAQKQQLVFDKKQIEQEVFSTLQDNLYQQKLLWEKLQLADKSVQIKQTSFTMAKQKFAAGRLSSFELIRIQDDVENAKVAHNSSLISYLNNRTMLDKLLHQTFSQWSVNVQIT